MTISKGDNTWLMLASALVILMSIPGAGLFYGGLVRAKNMLECADAGVHPVLPDHSALGHLRLFHRPSPRKGLLRFDKLLLVGVTPESIAATFSKGWGSAEFIYVVFQGFAAITCRLIVGASPSGWGSRPCCCSP